MSTQRMLPGRFSERAAVTAGPSRRRASEASQDGATPPARDAFHSCVLEATAPDYADGRQHAATLDRCR